MSLAVFLFQASLCLLIFYAFYRLFLHRETFFVWNRIYLISTLFFALAIPILRFEGLSRSSVSRELQVKMMEVLLKEQSEAGNAFSFFRFKQIDPNLADFNTINRHEEVHIQQFHSIDVLLMELAAVLLWFNPVIYLYQSSIKNIHEYLADEVAAEFEGSKRKYALLLLRKAMGMNPALTNSFLRQS
ncbi:hypothetical protein H9X96_00110 [Pedobacter sp. N36a]|uniref:M56 family metallopeptidase n=1 Tax=Pedobacter sp. N36a TaxID=2767996 RepID=UPI0016568FF4|nr:M56 family metallopeptidase [Pedobacter sp. N36a]MBC8984174.1 hypothetical protein [Pedobacter sp. N36a]